MPNEKQSGRNWNPHPHPFVQNCIPENNLDVVRVLSHLSVLLLGISIRKPQSQDLWGSRSYCWRRECTAVAQ